MIIFLLASLGAAVLVGFATVAFRLFRADCDLVLQTKTLKKDYFKDRVVWVTGASSGIGEQLSLQLSKLGAKIILSSRTRERLEDVQKRLHHPGNSRVLPLDLGEPESMPGVAKQAVELFGKVDMLINNGGIAQRGIYEDFLLETERRLVEVDFFGQIALTKALLPTLIDQGFGHIANVSSVAGKWGGPGRTIYSGAKFALIGFMDALRLELFGLGHNIPVTNICPGPVQTNVDRNALRGDGSFHQMDDPFIRSGMKAERCAELSLIAMSNQLNEIWVTPNPLLAMLYFNQYMPFLGSWLMYRQAADMVKAVIAKTRAKTD